MNNKLEEYCVHKNAVLLAALLKLDKNKQGFLVVVDNDNKVNGVLTDGDVRRAIIKGLTVTDPILGMYTENPKMVKVEDGLEPVIELFKNESISFLPIVNKDLVLENLITKKQMHALLLQDMQVELTYDFFSLDVNLVDHEIFPRPWGYFKTTVMNDYFQGKIISVKPGGQLSLQSHNHREEHWIVVHGTGVVQLDNSFKQVMCGSWVFLPKGCKHRLTNTDEHENLIITEVQIGDYFGEDDIIRYEDIYGRV